MAVSLLFCYSSISGPYEPIDALFPDETYEYGTSVEIANMIDVVIPRDKYSDEMFMVDMS